MEEDKMWELTEERYADIASVAYRLHNMAHEVRLALSSRGNLSVGVEECIFCKYYDQDDGEYAGDYTSCGDCPFGVEFGMCGVDSDSLWGTMFNAVTKVIEHTRKLNSAIRNTTDSLKARKEVRVMNIPELRKHRGIDIIQVMKKREEVIDAKRWAEENDAYYYARHVRDFSLSEAQLLAYRAGKKLVIIKSIAE